MNLVAAFAIILASTANAAPHGGGWNFPPASRDGGPPGGPPRVRVIIRDGTTAGNPDVVTILELGHLTNLERIAEILQIDPGQIHIIGFGLTTLVSSQNPPTPKLGDVDSVLTTLTTMHIHAEGDFSLERNGPVVLILIGRNDELGLGPESQPHHVLQEVQGRHAAARSCTSGGGGGGGSSGSGAGGTTFRPGHMLPPNGGSMATTLDGRKRPGKAVVPIAAESPSSTSSWKHSWKFNLRYMDWHNKKPLDSVHHPDGKLSIHINPKPHDTYNSLFNAVIRLLNHIIVQEGRFNAIEEGSVLTILENMKRNAKPLHRSAKLDKPSARTIMPMWVTPPDRGGDGSVDDQCGIHFGASRPNTAFDDDGADDSEEHSSGASHAEGVESVEVAPTTAEEAGSELPVDEVEASAAPAAEEAESELPLAEAEASAAPANAAGTRKRSCPTECTGASDSDFTTSPPNKKAAKAAAAKKKKNDETAEEPKCEDEAVEDNNFPSATGGRPKGMCAVCGKRANQTTVFCGHTCACKGCASRLMKDYGGLRGSREGMRSSASGGPRYPPGRINSGSAPKCPQCNVPIWGFMVVQQPMEFGGALAMTNKELAEEEREEDAKRAEAIDVEDDEDNEEEKVNEEGDESSSEY